MFSDLPTNHIIDAIAGRFSAVPYFYVDGRVYCEAKSPTFVVVWVVALHHSIVNKDVIVLNCLAIAVETEDRWNNNEKATKKAHRLKGARKNCEKGNENQSINITDPIVSMRAVVNE